MRVVFRADGSCPSCQAPVSTLIAARTGETTRTAPPTAPSVPDEGLAPGRLLGDYLIRERIGRGGMGDVYLAQHVRMQREVALKLIRMDRRQNSELFDRFQRETEALSRLNHENVVLAYDAREQDGVPMLVMEYLPGVSLQDLVDREGPLPVRQAVGFILQAARGLKAAHAVGILHRDIKPSNLLLVNGTIKILDFGLVGITSASQDGSGVKASASLTGTGAIMGTIHYMSPEQAANPRDADARADLYSLGCTLHYLLTGHPVFPRRDAPECLAAHRNDPAPRLTGAHPIPPSVEAVYQKLVAKSPDARYRSAAHLINDLEPIYGSLEFDFPSVYISRNPEPARDITLSSMNAICAAYVTGGPVAGCLLLGTNYIALSQPLRGALILGFLFAPAPLMFNFPAFALAVLLLEDHGRRVRQHTQVGGRTNSGKFGCLIGLMITAVTFIAFARIGRR